MRKDFQIRVASDLNQDEEVYNYPTKRRAERGWERVRAHIARRQDKVERHVELIEVIRQEEL
jgi:predicted transcriptional regulator